MICLQSGHCAIPPPVHQWNMVPSRPTLECKAHESNASIVLPSSQFLGKSPPDKQQVWVLACTYASIEHSKIKQSYQTNEAWIAALHIIFFQLFSHVCSKQQTQSAFWPGILSAFLINTFDICGAWEINVSNQLHTKKSNSKWNQAILYKSPNMHILRLSHALKNDMWNLGRPKDTKTPIPILVCMFFFHNQIWIALECICRIFLHP